MAAVMPSGTEQAKTCFNILPIGVGREIVWMLSPSKGSSHASLFSFVCDPRKASALFFKSYICRLTGFYTSHLSGPLIFLHLFYSEVQFP